MRHPETSRRPGLRSFALKLAVAALIFAVVPVILYARMEQTESQRNALMLQLVQEQGRLTGEALFPLLDDFSPSKADNLDRAVRTLAQNGLSVRVLFRPARTAGRQDLPQDFLLVTAAPLPTSADPSPRPLLAQLTASGVLAHLGASCDGNTPLSLRLAPSPSPQTGPNNQGEQGNQAEQDSQAGQTADLLTYLAPRSTPAGCWVVLTAQTTGSLPEQVIGRPYWQSPDLKVAASIYLLMAVLILSLFTDTWRDLRRFRSVARSIMRGQADTRFAAHNTVAELSEVAADLDTMVSTLRRSEGLLRQAAEENAHALKAPLAVISQSLDPIGRALPAEPPRAHRALDLIRQSVERLDTLVSAIRRTDETIAGLIDVPRQPVDLSALLARLGQGYARMAAERSVGLDLVLAPGLTVSGSEDLLEGMVENLLDNALDFSPPGGKIVLTLRPENGQAILGVRDHGPGVPEDRLEQIFERHVSIRPDAPNGPGLDHYGLGLWIVRRNAEAMNGTAWASNAPGDGLTVWISLPLR